jgi:hypothetical protein
MLTEEWFEEKLLPLAKDKKVVPCSSNMVNYYIYLVTSMHEDDI